MAALDSAGANLEALTLRVKVSGPQGHLDSGKLNDKSVGLDTSAQFSMGREEQCGRALSHTSRS